MNSSTINRICIQAFVRPRNLPPSRVFKTKWEPELAKKKQRKTAFKRERLNKFYDFDNSDFVDDITADYNDPAYFDYDFKDNDEYDYINTPTQTTQIKEIIRYKIVYYKDYTDTEDYGFFHPVYVPI
jgi:hypothetical protein